MRHAKAGGKEEVRGVKSSIPRRYAAFTFEGHIILVERSPARMSPVTLGRFAAPVVTPFPVSRFRIPLNRD